MSKSQYPDPPMPAFTQSIESKNLFYMEYPLVSVITVTLNRAATLERAIRSVVEQDYPCIDYIIVDGGSGDGSVDIIKRYESRIARWVSEPDHGLVEALNKALTMVSGDYVAFLPADDYFEPGALRAAMDAFRGYPDTDVVHADIRYFDRETGQVLICKPFKKTDREIYGDIYSWPAIYVNTFFIRRAAFSKLGTLDVSYPHAGDFEVYQRFVKNKARFLYVDRIMVNHQSGGKSDGSLRGYIEIKDIAIQYGCPRLKAYYHLARKVVERSLGKFLSGCGCGGLKTIYAKAFYPNITIEKGRQAV